MSPEKAHDVVQQDDQNSASGVEIESPHKAAQREKEENGEIPGVGQISTRWVGQRGKKDMIQEADREQCKTEAQGLRVELSTLANECKKALLVLGADESHDPQVQRANSLCDQYLKKTPSKHKPTSLSQKMDDLWKSQCEPGPCGVSEPATAATAALGQQLVDTITEKHKQPPDVSCYGWDSYHCYYQCFSVIGCAMSWAVGAGGLLYTDSLYPGVYAVFVR